MSSETGGDDLRVVLVTAPDAEVAERLARGLVEERLAACVNLIPGIRSFYRWEGAVRDDAEVLLVVKTRTDRLEALASWLQELHPYELPEILGLPVIGGSQAYLDWIRTESSP